MIGGGIKKTGRGKNLKFQKGFLGKKQIFFSNPKERNKGLVQKFWVLCPDPEVPKESVSLRNAIYPGFAYIWYGIKMHYILIFCF